MRHAGVFSRLKTRHPPAVPRAITPPAVLRITRKYPAAANRGRGAAGTPASRWLARRRPAAVALAMLTASTTLATNTDPHATNTQTLAKNTHP